MQTGYVVDQRYSYIYIALRNIIARIARKFSNYRHGTIPLPSLLVKATWNQSFEDEIFTLIDKANAIARL
jgi:hypothetical protein